MPGAFWLRLSRVRTCAGREFALSEVLSSCTAHQMQKKEEACDVRVDNNLNEERDSEMDKTPIHDKYRAR